MVYTSFLTFYFRFSAGQYKLITRTFRIDKTTNPLSHLLIINIKLLFHSAKYYLLNLLAFSVAVATSFVFSVLNCQACHPHPRLYFHLVAMLRTDGCFLVCYSFHYLHPLTGATLWA